MLPNQQALVLDSCLNLARYCFFWYDDRRRLKCMDDELIDQDDVMPAATNSNALIVDTIRANFADFCDDIMSMYGANDDKDQLESLSSTSAEELQEEYKRVSYRIQWLEALLSESRLELELIVNAQDSLATGPNH